MTAPSSVPPGPGNSERGRRARAVRLVALWVAIAMLGACRGQERGSLHEGRKPNRLIHEKSPYLLQHAYNPVDWRPWGEDAFADARRVDKPIFLSIGYSTCHWCHVMERESFEDPALAESLNEWFVPIKVDREERPDVDRVYMNAAFAITGGGGWPLSVFLTPEGKPFYAGTYFPPKPHGGLPSFLQVLRGVHEAWLERRGEVNASANELAGAIERAVKLEPDSAALQLDQVRRLGYEHLEQMFDARYGGFGRAPKFPQPSYFSFLFREWAAHGNARARDMALYTLQKMALGGVRDQLAGGFHRYSTDAEWRVPHFEKMLYDQAQLTTAYLEAYQVSGDPFFAGVALDITGDVSRHLKSPEGGFYSALDADSRAEDGTQEEGAYYVWTKAEIDSLLGAERAAEFDAHYGITAEGNFEPGKNVLHAERPAEDAALEKRLADDRARLLEARARRPMPHLDDKVLASWNGLMISAYARAASVLASKSHYTEAERAADFVWAHLWDEKTRTLRRRYRDGEAAVPGELSDYACLAEGEVDLFEAGSDERHLERAITLTDRAVELFWDPAQGGFFDTAQGSDPHLLVRSKEAHDGAEPSGNSVMFTVLARLATLLDRPDLAEKARTTLQLFSSHTGRSPLSLTQLWGAAYLLDGRASQVVIAGSASEPGFEALRRAALKPFRPGLVVILAEGGEQQKALASRLPYIASVVPVDGHAAAYLCENHTCGLPITSPEELSRRLAPSVASAAIP